MKILNLEQNTNEWLELRRTHIGASDCPIIMDKSPFKGPSTLWREKVFGQESYVSKAMKRGSELENDSLMEYNLINGTSFSPTVAINEDLPWQLASFDGWEINRDYTLEIKVPGDNSFDSIQAGKFPEYWEWQAQHQMSVSGLSRVVFFVYSQDRDPLTIIVDRDEDKIKQLIEKETKFYSCMVEFEEPECGANETQYTVREDEEWKRLAQERFEIDEAKKELAARDAANRQAFIDLGNGVPCKGFGVTLSVQKGRNMVDYNAIPEIKCVDLSAYTRRGEPSWKLSLSRKEFTL